MWNTIIQRNEHFVLIYGRTEIQNGKIFSNGEKNNVQRKEIWSVVQKVKEIIIFFKLYT